MMQKSRQGWSRLDANRIGHQSPACSGSKGPNHGAREGHEGDFFTVYASQMTGACLQLSLLILLMVTDSRLAGADEGRFQRLDAQGTPLANGTGESPWSCVLDHQSGLIWETKTLEPGLHQRDRNFSWYQPDPRRNGGDAGDPGTQDCANAPCNTQALVDAVNQQGWCGAHDWRLPTREELRSLVDYRIPYPGPSLDRRYFPHARAQFHWSATPSAANPEEAWGIGFAFGFDYAYFKGDRVPVRLVREARP